MLYEIKEQTGKVPFKLFLKKKKGFKFKKSFHSLESANWFIENYLRHCCLGCKQNGWVYKTRRTDGLHGRIREVTMHGLGAGSTVYCPECRAKHLVEYENREVQSWIYDNKGRHPYTATVQDLVLKFITN